MSQEEATHLEDGLRTTSDALIATLDELYAIEEEKRRLRPSSPRFTELASRVESLAQAALGHSRRQEELAQLTRESAAVGNVVGTPIEEIGPRAIHAVLADWRAAERRLQAAAAGTPEHDEATTDINRLRDEYRRAMAAAQDGN